MKIATMLAGSRLVMTGVLAEVRGDHIRERVNLRTLRADRLAANRQKMAAGHMDRQRNRVENRLDRRGNRMDRHVDRRLGGDR
jgi:hypothetical protein